MMQDKFGQRVSGFQPLTDAEMQAVEGGLSWSGLWDAVKGAAGWVKDHIFVDLGSRIFGYKGTF